MEMPNKRTLKINKIKYLFYVFEVIIIMIFELHIFFNPNIAMPKSSHINHFLTL